MEVAKIFGRFNPKVCRFDVGIGGLQEFDTHDYLAALSYMKSEFGRDLLCRMYWPEGAKLSLEELKKGMYARLVDEWVKREYDMLMAIPGLPDGGGTLQRFQRADARRWPGMAIDKDGKPKHDPRYASLCHAALTELFTADPCKTCNGLGEITDADGVKFECLVCLGFGRKAWGYRTRAKAIGVNEKSYKEQGWDRAYVWAVRTMLKEVDQDYMNALGSEWGVESSPAKGITCDGANDEA